MKRLEDLKAFMMTSDERARRDGSVNVNEISRALGIDEDDGQNLARHLHAIGWARVHCEAETRLYLTDTGYQKIARWRQAFWKRWPDEHPWIMGIAGGAMAGVITNLLSSWLTK